jgi:hypothetical protein
MHTSQDSPAIRAALSCATALGLQADDAVVLHDSNRAALRLLPCDILARVAPPRHQAGAAFELDVARRLAGTAAPIAGLDRRVEPRVHLHDGFAITFWTYFEPLPPLELTPEEYALALHQLHAGMRDADMAVPHFTDRAAEALRIVDNHDLSPEIENDDREFLGSTLRELTSDITARGAPEQLIHGEPHPGNLLRTNAGLLFIDLETCCRGPVEFDIAHAADGVSTWYPGVDRGLLRDCQALAMALVAAWRWDRTDQFPDGRKMGLDLLAYLRSTMAHRR